MEDDRESSSSHINYMPTNNLQMIPNVMHSFGKITLCE